MKAVPRASTEKEGGSLYSQEGAVLGTVTIWQGRSAAATPARITAAMGRKLLTRAQALPI